MNSFKALYTGNCRSSPPRHAFKPFIARLLVDYSLHTVYLLWNLALPVTCLSLVSSCTKPLPLAQCLNRCGASGSQRVVVAAAIVLLFSVQQRRRRSSSGGFLSVVRVGSPDGKPSLVLTKTSFLFKLDSLPVWRGVCLACLTATVHWTRNYLEYQTIKLRSQSSQRTGSGKKALETARLLGAALQDWRAHDV